MRINNHNSNDDNNDPFQNEGTKPYVQFSKKVVNTLLAITSIVVIYAMIMGVKLLSETIVVTLITSIVVTALGGIIWYMKNSEAEKKARIQLEIEKLNPDSKINVQDTIPTDDPINDTSDSMNNIDDDACG